MLSTATLRIIHAGHDIITADEIARLYNFVIQPSSPWISMNETTIFRRALAGQFAETSDDYFFVLADEGEPLAHAWYQVSRRNPAVAVLGYVYTDVKARGRGLATHLTNVVWEHFVSRGGEAMYLGTSNPTALKVYLQSGFQVHNGHVLRRISREDGDAFDQRRFERGVNVHVRPAEAGDLAMATSLYVHPFSWRVRDFSEDILIEPGHELVRCNSIYIALFLRSESPANSMVVLETEDQRLVGCASFISRNGREAVLEFLVHPNYAEQAGPLLRGLMPEGVSLVCYAAPDDGIKITILKYCGFREREESTIHPGVLVFRLSTQPLSH